MTNRTALRVLVALAAALCLVTSAIADRENAKFLVARGDKAVAAKKWDEAEGHFRKAMEEDATFLPARYGLALALLGAGKSAPAIEELRAFIDGVRATDPVPPEWKPLLAKAEKQLGDLDAAGTALKKIVDGHAEDLVALGERWLTKDPPVAERALRRALKLKPGHAKATQLLEKMGRSAAGEVTELFDGTSLDGWESAHAPTFQVQDGELIGTCRDAAYYTRSMRIFEGDFDVRLEARIVESYPGPVFFALMPCWKAEYDHYSLGTLRGKVVLTETTSADHDRDIASIVPSNLKKPFDPAKWNVFEMRFRGNEVTALVNGEEIAKEARPAARKGGFVGLQIQNLRVAFRKIQVEVR